MWPFKHKAQGTRHKAQGTRHKAQGTGHKAQGTGHKPAVFGLLLSALCLLLSLPACSSRSYKETQLLMDTVGEITVYEKNSQKAQNSIKEAFLEMKRIENLLSIFNPESEISKLNQNKSVLVSPETINLIRRSLEISQITRGAFDISIYPGEEKWGFYDQKYRVPSSEELKTTKDLINYKNIVIKGNAVRFKRPAMKIDLGGIAKGYAVDRAVEVLKEKGITSALVNLGGDIYALGMKRKKPWRVGVQHPRNPGETLTVLELENKAIATSGDYERFFEKESHKYGHILDPFSNRPADECVSVTVIAEDATTADALATGIFVLGKDEGLKLVESLPDTEVIIVDSKREVFTSSGLSFIGNRGNNRK